VRVSTTPLRSFLERFDWFRWSGIFRHTPHRFKGDGGTFEDFEYDPEITRYHSGARVDYFVNVVICVAGFVMLTAPPWILLYVSSRSAQLGIITGFIGLFLTIVQSVSIARPFESLAATAA
jgi:hypothetical protein